MNREKVKLAKVRNTKIWHFVTFGCASLKKLLWKSSPPPPAGKTKFILFISKLFQDKFDNIMIFHLVALVRRFSGSQKNQIWKRSCIVAVGWWEKSPNLIFSIRYNTEKLLLVNKSKTKLFKSYFIFRSRILCKGPYKNLN